MTTNRTIQRVRRGGVVLAAALAAACAAPTTHAARLSATSPCADSSYLKLRQQHPDSLSERAWQRLQTLDRECAAAPAPSSREANGMATGMRHDSSHMMGAGIVATIVMVAMIVSMW